MKDIDFSNIDWKSFLMEYGIGLLKFFAVLIIGLWVVKKVVAALKKVLTKGSMDPLLQGYLMSTVTAILKLVVYFAALGVLGVELTAFIAIFGAAALAIGMALSGTLQNFAGGVMLLVLRPFEVGDLITAQGHTGVVLEIGIVVTKILTPDNKTVIIPNGPLANEDITNYTTDGKIRVDLEMGIGYGDDIKAAKAVLIKVMTDHPKVLATPAPFVGVGGHGASSVDLHVRPYCTPEDYWTVYYDVYEEAKIALDAAGIEIPFPQRVVHNA